MSDLLRNVSGCPMDNVCARSGRPTRSCVSVTPGYDAFAPAYAICPVVTSEMTDLYEKRIDAGDYEERQLLRPWEAISIARSMPDSSLAAEAFDEGARLLAEIIDDPTTDLYVKLEAGHLLNQLPIFEATPYGEPATLAIASLSRFACAQSVNAVLPYCKKGANKENGHLAEVMIGGILGREAVRRCDPTLTPFFADIRQDSNPRGPAHFNHDILTDGGIPIQVKYRDAEGKLVSHYDSKILGVSLIDLFTMVSKDLYNEEDGYEIIKLVRKTGRILVEEASSMTLHKGQLKPLNAAGEILVDRIKLHPMNKNR